MRPRGSRWAWPFAGGYLVLALLPLVLVAADTTPHAWHAALARASGFIAYSVIVLQVVLVARLGSVSRQIGSDALMHLHRGLAAAGLLFLLAHPVLLTGSSVVWSDWNPVRASDAVRPGALAMWAVIAIVVTSVARARLRLRYEVWHVLHLTLAVAAILGAAAHILEFGRPDTPGPPQVATLVYAGGALLILTWYRVARPWRLTRQPWRVVSNADAGGSTRLLRVVPDGHAGMAFEAGQFAWVSTGRSPLFSQQHPLSMASSDAGGAEAGVEFAVKSLGDWSGEVVPRLRPGDRLWVDGPFGAFTPARAGEARGWLLVAGGIGIAPVRSILLSLRDRQERRPVVLVHAADSPVRAVFSDELAALRDDLDLTLVPIYEHPPEDWPGERGLVTEAVLARHLPADRSGWAYFACGPEPMMVAVERHLRALGVPAEAVHTERFTMV